MSYGGSYGLGGGYGGGGRGGVYGGWGSLNSQVRGQGRGFGRGGRGGFGANKKPDARKIFVGGVSKRDTNSETFEQFFKSFGEVEDIILMKARDGSDGHRGFGFVTYKDQEVTDSVLAQAGQLDLDGRFVDVKMAIPPEMNPPEGVDGKKLFIGSLPKENFSSDDLKQYFSKWGALSDSWVSEGRGFGFVTYEERNSAYKALIQGVDGGHSVREGMQLDVKWATPKPGQGGARGGYGAPVVGGYGVAGGYGVSLGAPQQSFGGYSAGAFTSGAGYMGGVGRGYQPY